MTTTADQSSEKNARLDDLLSKFEEEYGNDPQYNYVESLEKEKDKVNERRISRERERLMSEVDSEKNIFDKHEEDE